MLTFRDYVLARTADLTLQEMADELGVSVAYACNLRKGQRGRRALSRRIAARALKNWPDLTDAYLRDLHAQESSEADAGKTPQAVA